MRCAVPLCVSVMAYIRVHVSVAPIWAPLQARLYYGRVAQSTWLTLEREAPFITGAGWLFEHPEMLLGQPPWGGSRSCCAWGPLECVKGYGWLFFIQ